MLTKDEVLEALHAVEDPELGMDIVELGLLYDVEVDGLQRFVDSRGHGAVESGWSSRWKAATTPSTPSRTPPGRRRRLPWHRWGTDIERRGRPDPKGAPYGLIRPPATGEAHPQLELSGPMEKTILPNCSPA
jgi:iron-sulfur cluster assembly protein